MKKRIPTPAELTNDPSLRWTPYTRWEAVWSDDLKEYARFSRYTDDGNIVLASINGVTEFPDTVDPLTVRRSQTRQELSREMKNDILMGSVAAARRRLGLTRDVPEEGTT